MSTIRVLYVEDDAKLARLTAEYLSSHGVEVELVNRGDLAASAVARVRPDVVLLDLMLPGRDGMDVCRDLRSRHDVPIIMVTARIDAADRVVGLEGGADDYVLKPFQSRELLARIRAQVRRARGEAGPRADRIEIGSLVVDTGSREVILGGRVVQVTAKEFDVIAALAQFSGRVLDRERLLEIIHGTQEEAFERSIDVMISRIRAKLGDDPKHPRLVKTVRGAGYVLTAGER